MTIECTKSKNCVEKEQERIISNQPETARATNKETVDTFVNEDLLKGVKIEQMYPADRVVESLGSVISETIEDADIDYEGMKGRSIKKIEYKTFYAVIYQLEDGNEIFGYLLLKDNIEYSRFTIGTDIRKYIDIEGDSINKWDKEMLTIYGNYNGDWDMSITVYYDSAYIIKRIEIGIGGI